MQTHIFSYLLFVACDASSLDSGDFGFNRTHQPGDLLKMSQDRMKVNALASSLRARYTPESLAMAWFFRDSLDRESIRDYFKLQVNKQKTCITEYVYTGFIPRP